MQTLKSFGRPSIMVINLQTSSAGVEVTETEEFRFLDQSAQHICMMSETTMTF